MNHLKRCFLLFGLLVFVFNSAHAKAPVDGGVKLRVENSLSKLPLRFEKNEGQISDEVKFFSRGSGYTMYFTPTEAVTVLSRTAVGGRSMEDLIYDPADLNEVRRKSSHQTSEIFQSNNNPLHRKVVEPVKRETSVVRMEVVGANEKAKVTGQDKLPGTSNYFKGNDRSKWRQGVENFQKVYYEEVYEGIDLVYYGNQRKLEYDFIVKPGADPEKIELSFKGTETLSIDESGNLVLETKTGTVVQQSPVIYQTISGKKQTVEGKYVIKDNHNVAFELAQYNPEHNLVIDPVLEFATYVGGNSADTVLDITVDEAGSIYMTGWTVSPDFNVLNEIEGATADVDVIVLKLDRSGSAPSLAWSTYLGGTGIDGGGSIAVDSVGNVYVAGSTTSADFDMLNAIEGPSGLSDVIVFKLEQAGNIPTLAFSTYLGGSSFDNGEGIVVDSTGNIFVTGVTGSTDFDMLNAIEGDSDFTDVFVFKLEQSNNIPSLGFSTYLGGNSIEKPVDIALDTSGNVYVAGETRSVDFNLKNPLQASSGGNQGGDFFLFKLEQNGNVPSLGFSTFAGGFTLSGPSPIGPGDSLEAMTVDVSGNIYLTGFLYRNTIPFVNNIRPGVTPNRFNSEAFVMKLQQSANTLSIGYSTKLGGILPDFIFDVITDNVGNVYVTGQSGSFDFPVVDALPENALGGNFLMKLVDNNNVPGIAFSSRFGLTEDAALLSGVKSVIAADDSGKVYVAGSSDYSGLNLLNEIEGFNGDLDFYLVGVDFGASTDTIPPVVTAPADLIAEATGPLSSPVIGTATATDNVSAPADIIITSDAPASGFLVGLTVVTWTAEDEAGNTSTATQNVTVTDTTSPLITILGANPINAEIGEPYVDPWATATDLVDGAVAVTATSQEGATPGTFEVIYSATDASGNTATATRIINAVDTTPPVITILGDNPIDAPVGVPYVDPWATAVDSVDGPVVVSATTQVGAAPNTLEVVYSASDSSGNTATATRVVVVVP